MYATCSGRTRRFWSPHTMSLPSKSATSVLSVPAEMLPTGASVSGLTMHG
eukprot:CAMPEP_0171883502 /NCGR_PEP_ID=MMETSP0992-20121227/40207_1 /TAXON_ID=483369 /ORGANISM="non described non described, Strain CCMP2098" /LENGTH=49 /DNA_ID= /DNA_START= /DNA_END= /DNA_ORIENTATION=